MTKKLFLLAILIPIVTQQTFSQSKKEKAVAMAVENLRKAMIDPDKEKLTALVSGDLMYGHSLGQLEDKQTFIETLVSGKSDFVAISLSDQKIHP